MRRAFHFRLVPIFLALVLGLVLALAVSAQDPGEAKPPAPQSATQATQPPAGAPVPAAATATPQALPPAAATADVPKIVVPSGTRLPLVLHNGISTKSARAGDPVYFETLFPIIVDGRVVIPAGSYVSGEITETKRAGRVKGRAELLIRLNQMILPNAYVVRLDAVPSSAGTGGGETTDSEGKIKGDTDKTSDAGTIVKSATVGAGIGALAGGLKGAGIGLGIGAAGGLLTTLLTRGPDAELPRGTTVDASLDRPLYLDADKITFTGLGQTSTLPGPPNREPTRSKIPF
jgi:hypothetical protein